MAARVGASLLGASSAPSLCRSSVSDDGGASADTAFSGGSHILPSLLGTTRSHKEYARTVAALTRAQTSQGLLTSLRVRMQAGVIAACERQGATCGEPTTTVDGTVADVVEAGCSETSGAASLELNQPTGKAAPAAAAAPPHVYDSAAFASNLERLSKAAAEAEAVGRALAAGVGGFASDSSPYSSGASGALFWPPQWHVVLPRPQTR